MVHWAWLIVAGLAGAVLSYVGQLVLFYWSLNRPWMVGEETCEDQLEFSLEELEALLSQQQATYDSFGED